MRMPERGVREGFERGNARDIRIGGIAQLET